MLRMQPHNSPHPWVQVPLLFPIIIIPYYSLLFPTIPYYSLFILIAFIWVNYNILLAWIKAICGWFPVLTFISVRSQLRSL